jgi:Hemerythrin HHE cation binding domain
MRSPYEAGVMRVDLYATIHKAQRFHLFELANAIGCADMGKDTLAATLTERVRRVIEHLRDHGQNEERYIHPLFDRAGGGADSLRHGHEELEADLQEVEQMLDEGRQQDLYAAYTRFLGKYLLHLSEEEDAQRQVLWPRYDDNALNAVLARFKAERPREKAAADFEFMLPALSTAELGRLFRGMKHAATPDVFDHACDQARRLLGANKWRQVAITIDSVESE